MAQISIIVIDPQLGALTKPTLIVQLIEGWIKLVGNATPRYK